VVVVVIGKNVVVVVGLLVVVVLIGVGIEKSKSSPKQQLGQS
jgi:hypothetical protein